MKSNALRAIKADMGRKGISEGDLEKFWWHDGRTPAQDFWFAGMVKHNRLSTIDSISDYASTTYKLVDPILNSGENYPGLADFLYLEELYIGKYHTVKKHMAVLKEFFGVDVYPTFVGQGRHLVLFEIGVLYRDGKMIDHPLAHTVPCGQFLMRHI